MVRKLSILLGSGGPGPAHFCLDVLGREAEAFQQLGLGAVLLGKGVGDGEAAEPGHPIHQVISTLLEKAGDELGALASETGRASELEEQGILTLCEVRADQKQIDEIRKKLMKLLEGLSRMDECEPAAEKRFRLLIAYYPLTERLSRG